MSTPCARSSAGFSGRKRSNRRAPDARAADRYSGTLRRAREADVRAAVAGVPRRPHARRHLHARTRAELPHLSGDRCDRRSSRAVAPPGSSRADRANARRSASIRRSCSRWFLDKLQSTPEGDGTLLDHSLFLYGAGLSNPNTHAHTDLPLLVVGGATVGIDGEPAPRRPRQVPMTNLLLTLLDKVGVRADTLGDSTGLAGDARDPTPTGLYGQRRSVAFCTVRSRVCGLRRRRRRGRRRSRCIALSARTISSSTRRPATSPRDRCWRRRRMSTRRKQTDRPRCTGQSRTTMTRLVAVLLQAGARRRCQPARHRAAPSRGHQRERVDRQAADCRRRGRERRNAGWRDAADDGGAHRRCRGGQDSAHTRCRRRCARKGGADRRH